MSKYPHLLEEDETFRAWYRNVLRAFHNTGAWYLLRMECLCDELCQVTRRQPNGPGTSVALENFLERS